MPLKPFEAIVIGSGATGGVAAQTLAEAGVRVLVVETGPDLSAQEALGSEPINSLRRVRGLLSGQHTTQSFMPMSGAIPIPHPKINPFSGHKGAKLAGEV